MNNRTVFIVPFLSLTLLHAVPAQQQRDRVTSDVAHNISPSIPQNISHNAGLQQDGSDELFGGGADYMVRFSPKTMRFHPALGSAVATLQHLELTPEQVRRGGQPIVSGTLAATPRQQQLRASYAFAPGIEQRYDVGPDGMELTWKFDHRPAGSGDLVVRYAVDTSLPAPQATEAGGLTFELSEFGGVAIGGVTGIDARGTRVPGALRWTDGALELSLPSAFVDDAAYPIVLDPTFSTKFGVATSGSDDSRPDVAYDRSLNRYLVIFLRTFSANSVLPRAQLVSGTGTLVGSTIFPVTTPAKTTRARVANLPARNRFGIVWAQEIGSDNTLNFRAISAGNGSITHAAQLAILPGTDVFVDPDIAGDSLATTGISNTRGFVITWEDNFFDAIRARRIYFDGLDSLLATSPVDVLANSPGLAGAAYTQPEVSRLAGNDSTLLVTARRSTLFGQQIAVAALRSDTLTVEGTTSFGGLVNQVEQQPDVDGYNGQWVVAWTRAASLLAPPLIAQRTVRFDGANFDLSPEQTFWTSSTSFPSWPTVGYTPGRTWLGYRVTTNTLVQLTSLQAAATDSGSSVWCDDTFVEPISNSSADVRIVVGTQTSGGRTSGELALCVFGEDGDVFAQQLQNYGTGGSYTNLGGGCGGSGNPTFSHLPGIGSSGLVCSISGLPPTAVLTLFNFVPASSMFPCGPCVWAPLTITLTPPLLFGTASVEFPIPCLPSLVGSNFDTQWTTIDFTQTPCSLLPGLVVSDITRMTIGN